MSARDARRHAVRACAGTGKAAYDFHDAQRVAQRKRRRTGEVVVPYRCDRCRAWHVGHPSTGRRRAA